jgi:hypothetical protein
LLISFLLIAFSDSSANDSRALTPDRKDHKQELAFSRKPDPGIPALLFRVILVVKFNASGIRKRAPAFLECDAVIANIVHGFVVVPFEECILYMDIIWP